jgi:hypothetical protein
VLRIVVQALRIVVQTSKSWHSQRESAKTLVTHIDDGFDFLGFRFKRKLHGGKRQVCTFPNPKSFAAVKRTA